MPLSRSFQMTDPTSLTIASISLLVSATTAWLTLFHRGTIKISRPSVLYFGPDSYNRQRKSPKVYIRTLLFSTSKRGRVIESMHVSFSRGEARQNFSIWVYGERGKLVRGSGLFIGETGVSLDHHFLTPPNEAAFKFCEGGYRLEIFIRILGEETDRRVFSQHVNITRDIADEMARREVGLYFDWGPDSSQYIPHVDEGPETSPDAETLLKSLVQHTSM